MNVKKLLIASALASAAVSAQAQLPIDLGAAPMSFGGLPSPDFSALPLNALSDAGIPVNPPIARFADGGLQLIGMGAIIAQNPESALRPVEMLAIPVAYTLAPGFEQLVNRPEQTPEYYMGGGTILLPDIAILPRIPLVTEPLMLPTP
ncbi:hypothetical protein HCU74_17910 [Spongiibacter sp. KMU-166]|uniref:Uncharacterized protein n=1 Tax=Spongiibacter thalassae TaxID=2721624 RepID=A0ABX1GJY8_9GAMM|nr:hypothetical protein [Spongiibacter thalassae]NKI19286.1 hypothetical protein [Spongiibacter thalassae]